MTVVDEAGQPVPDAAVDVGMLAGQGDRSRHADVTDDQGIATFSALPTGSSQAYRVNVRYEGATYGSTPFRLPIDAGYDVRIERTPVTTDDRFVFFHTYMVSVDLRAERLHIIHRAQLTNAGRETFVFPEEGLEVALPPGAQAFQFQDVMTDQRVEEVRGRSAYRIRGSLPTGTVSLVWAYDLDADEESMTIPVEIPLHFFRVQVLGVALPGMEMSVRGLPPPRRFDNNAQPCEDALASAGCAWVTQLQRGPEDASLETLAIHLTGVPQPSGLRWWASGLGLGLLILGLVFRFRRRDPLGSGHRSRADRRTALLAEARELEDELDAGEVGAEFRQKRHAAIVRELAVLLHQDDVADTGGDRRGAGSRGSGSGR